MTFIVDIAPDLPPIIGDAERIRQILANLIGNSYNYTPLDGKVMVKLRRLDSEVQVDIEDNGVGIPIKDQPRVFERFYRGNDPLVLATAGTGLGLAMAKTLVEMHHGRIWFHSSGAPGKGSIFSFIIPLVQPEE
jgi:two-component system phosphate regulon sensor histidine kinase PhoR